MDNLLIYSEDHSAIIGCDKSYSGEIIVPEGIICIADNAFENCSISRIVLQSSIKKIGRRAFANCSNLGDAFLNEGLVEIAPLAFYGCNSLVKIKMPSCLGRFGGSGNNIFYNEGRVFEGCVSLKSVEIPKGVTEIPCMTFAGCVNLLSIRLPKTVRTIGIDAFENCVSLQKVIISDIARWCYVKKSSNPLDYAHHLFIDDETEIVDLEIPEKIDSISAHSFEKCTGIKKVCFPDGYVNVGKNAFKGCVGLKELTLYSNNVGEILSELEGCDNIEVINIKCYNSNICIGLKGFKKLKAVYSIDDSGIKTQVDVDSVITAKAQEMKLMSMYYHNINMNLTMVQGKYPDKASFKAPIAKDGMLLENLYSSKQDTSILLKQDWINVSGMGLVLGWNDLRALDFDNFISRYNILEDDGEYNIEDYDIGKYRQECLSLLGLPENYQWVVWSGSRYGFHIIIRVKDFEERDSSRIAYSYYSGSSHRRIELRWKGHLVLPPSIHYSGEAYRFFNNQIPTTEPAYIDLGKIENLLDYYCGENHYYTYNWGQRSFEIVERVKINAESDSQGLYYDSREEKKGRNYIKWLETCATSQAYNTLAIKYLLGEDVPANKHKAFEYFKIATSQKTLELIPYNPFENSPLRICDVNNSHALFNIASLMSIGFFEGTQKEINNCLEGINIKDLYLPFEVDDSSFPEECIENKIDRIRKQAAKYIHHNIYLFFDTETTGIPNDYNAPSSDTDNWPRLVQLAWILEDETGTRIQSRNYIVRPEGFEIPEEAAKIHGINTELADNEGFDLYEVINEFIEDLNVATNVVGHNVAFDKKILGAEMIRLDMKDELEKKKSYCTMQSSIDFCKIPGKYGFKYPKLQELYRKLFRSEERRVGKECRLLCRSRWSPYH